MFSERCASISATISNIKSNINEFEKQIELEDKKEAGRKAIVPKIENVLDIYSKLNTPEEKNLLLKTVVKKSRIFKDRKSNKKRF